MTSLRALAIAALIVWMFVDSALVFRRRTSKRENRDRRSMYVVAFGNLAGWVIAVWVAFTSYGPIRPAAPVQIAGFIVMAIGIAIRFTAIAQLGRFHTPNVAILADHELIDRGLYRRVRHPSYLGALIAFLGFGLALGNWISVAVLVVLDTGAYLYRIREEEAALRAGLGERYAAYCRRTRRLIPGLY